MIIEDFDAIRGRVDELRRESVPAKPVGMPFRQGKPGPGEHCGHCQLLDSERCMLSCIGSYREQFGVEPNVGEAVLDGCDD